MTSTQYQSHSASGSFARSYVESRVRWILSAGENVGGSRFSASAEQCGMMHDLGISILKKVGETTRTWDAPSKTYGNLIKPPVAQHKAGSKVHAA